MKRKRIYVSPAVQVVEMKTRGVLLGGSGSASLQQYEYEDDGWTD